MSGVAGMIVAAIMAGGFAVIAFEPFGNTARAANVPAAGKVSVTGTVEQLISLWHLENSTCRGSTKPESVETKASCENREVMGAALNAAGWCHGRRGQIGADMNWHRCEPGSLGNPGASRMEEYGVADIPAIVEASQTNEIRFRRDYKDRMFRGQLRLTTVSGTSSKSESRVGLEAGGKEGGLPHRYSGND